MTREIEAEDPPCECDRVLRDLKSLVDEETKGFCLFVFRYLQSKILTLLDVHYFPYILQLGLLLHLITPGLKPRII